MNHPIPSLFRPSYPVGRTVELSRIAQTFASDRDLMLTGVTGSGRRALIRYAAQQVGARVLELDCLRANTSERFLRLLAEGVLELCAMLSAGQLAEQWSKQQQIPLIPWGRRFQIDWKTVAQQPWLLFQALLTLPQTLAEHLDCRVVFVFQNFPHIRSWDRSKQWEIYLREEIQQQSRVSYAMIATVPEDWGHTSPLEIISLPPLPQSVLQDWLIEEMVAQDLKFEADALALFLDYVQGHIGDACTLARRIWVDYRAIAEPNAWLGLSTSSLYPSCSTIQLDQVHRSTQALIDDLSTTFESLLLLLPSIQARVLESLAIDPTDSPHAREYIQKHQLSRGGGLQGALASLEQKGLIYGPKEKYAIALPLLRLWLKHRLG